MSNVTRHRRSRLAAIAAGLTTAFIFAAPAGLAQAATSSTSAAGSGGYTPNSAEWWFKAWGVQQYVWPLSQGAGVTVGVVDSGVQASIPDLRGVVVPGGDTQGGDSNGEQDLSADSNGHGTEVAALIAGQGYGTGEVGIAPKAKILPVHANSPAKSSDEDIADGIDYAVQHGAKVINVSLGGPTASSTSCDVVEQDAVADAIAHNVVVIAAAGDTNVDGSSPIAPASCAGVLAVGAIGENGKLWPDSTQASYVSVVAPGSQMRIVGRNGQYSTGGEGTSFAAPLVSATAAIIRAQYPTMPWYLVDEQIIGTAIATGSGTPNDAYGYGIMNIGKAVNPKKYPAPNNAPDPPYTSYVNWLHTSEGQSWAAQNGVTVPGAGSSPAATAPAGKTPAAAAPSPSAKKSSGSSALIGIIIAIVVVVILIAGAIVLLIRRRSRNGPGGPGGPGGGGFSGPGGPGAPSGYAPPPGPSAYAPPQYPPPAPQSPYPPAPPQGPSAQG